MRAEQGAIIASLTVHLLFFSLICALHHLKPPSQELSPAPVYVNLGEYFQTTADAAPAPTPSPAHLLSSSKGPESDEPPAASEVEHQSVREQQSIPIKEPPPLTLPARHPRKIAPKPEKTREHVQQQPRTANRLKEPIKQSSTPPSPLPARHESKPTPVSQLIPGRSAVTTPVIAGRPTADSAPALPAATNADSGYLAENYACIRELIAKNIVFPPIARKLGWRGRLTVSFVLDSTGNASAITIIDSSGKEVLDRNVIAAIKKTAPFPSPERMVTLVLPVTYNLR